MNGKRLCEVAGCGRKHYAKGLCHPHYMRKRLTGNVQESVPLRCAPGDCFDWLREHVSHEGEDCLIWPFALNGKSRPCVVYEGKRIVASRLMCILRRGDPPSEEMEAGHSCGNGHLGCINPMHLDWKTAQQNCIDRFDHGTMPCAKLTEADVLAIRRIGRSQTTVSLATQYGVSPTAISSVLTRKTWKHI